MRTAVRLFLIFPLAFVSSLGCQRKTDGNSASVAIPIPTVQAMKAAMGKESSLAAIPYERLCFVANVKGSGISSSTKDCDIERGTFAGGTKPGDTLTIEVLSGPGRTFEIFGYLRNSVSDPCPTIEADKWNWPLDKVYFLGRTENVTVDYPESNVTVKISMPETTQNIVVQNSWPNSCLPAPILANQTGPGRIQVSAHKLTGTNFRLTGRVSDKKEGQVLSGSQFQLRGRIQ